MTSVLVVDDDPAIRRALSISLRAHGYHVQSAGDGRSALQVVQEEEPDVLLLDLGLPDLDGIAVLRTLREFSRLPVIVVSARSQPYDTVEALDLGADDYVTKPFSIEELLARVRVCVRRTLVEDTVPQIRVGDLTLDVEQSRAERAGVAIHLTPIEWKIVAELTRRPGRLVRQGELLRNVWGPGYERQTNYLRVHLAGIRRKLEVDPGDPRLFVTEPGIGYRFAPTQSPTQQPG